jgi:hypothetical protein
MTGDASRNVAAVAHVLEAHGFTGRWAFRGNYPGGECYGLTEPALHQLYRDADAFLNVTAAQELREEHLSIPRRIYVESDPFPAQVKAAQGDAATIAMLAAHDTHFTFGESVGTSDCWLPDAGIRWLPTRQPVVLDLWPQQQAPTSSAYRTITTWHNKSKELEWQGETYHWTKDREFLKVLELPHRARAHFELAVDVDDATRQQLHDCRWETTSSTKLSASVQDYRAYIQHSRGEFTVARDQYVRPSTGWFSDRSACYLAAGRPVVTQDTGFGRHLPTGKGLFAYQTIDDAAAAIEEIESDYDAHCRGARDVAAEYFDAETILGSLLDRAGL